MKRLPLLVLVGALACGKPAPPAPPTVAAIGAELATFPQVLVPLSEKAWVDYTEAVSREGAANVTSASFRLAYMHGEASGKSKKAAVFVAYATPWEAPAKAPLQPMSVLQFLRAFAVDAETELAVVRAAKGGIIFSREQLPDVIGAARGAGASSEVLPFSLVRGSGR